MLTVPQRAALLRARRCARAITLPREQRPATWTNVPADDLDAAHLIVDLIDGILAEPATVEPSPWTEAGGAHRADDPEPDPQTNIAAFLMSPAGERIIRRIVNRMRQEDREQ